MKSGNDFWTAPEAYGPRDDFALHTTFEGREPISHGFRKFG